MTRSATPDNPVILETMDFPKPVIHIAIEPKTKADQQKMGSGLQKLAEEDPTFTVRTDEETGQTIIGGMGELHLEIIVSRLMREFKVDANVGKPEVAYRETISPPGRGSPRARSSVRPVGPACSPNSSSTCSRPGPWPRTTTS